MFYDGSFLDISVRKWGNPFIELFQTFCLLSGERQENHKENLNLENYRDQEPPDASCQASGGTPSQVSLSGFFSEDELRCFGEGEKLPEVQENLQGEGTGVSCVLRKGLLGNS